MFFCIKIYLKGEIYSMKKKILFSLLTFVVLCHAASALELAQEVKNPEAGEIVKFGKFNGSELSWLVLDVDEKNKRALLITENCVVNQKFAYSNYEWSNSYVRAYLNSTDGNNFFTSSNFTDAEKEKILKVSINKNNLSKKSDQIINSSGPDSVFLLSVKDANEYFENDAKRVCKFNNSNCRWWLRLSTNSYAKAGYVSSKGKVFPDGTLVSYALAVRPAIWVTLPIDDTTPTEDIITADGKSILAMTEDEIKAKYENKKNIAITGELDSSDLATILEKIGKVTMIENLDLRELNISEFKLDHVTSLININFEGNQYIETVKTQDSSVFTLNLSGSSVKEIEVDSCEFLEEVNLENCENAVRVNFNQTSLNKLVVKGCKNLTELSCEREKNEDIEGLINLDIEDCTNLVKLNVKNNSLLKLKVSNDKFPKLEEFTCGNQYIQRGLIPTFNFNNFLQNSLISPATVADTAEENSDLNGIRNLKVYDESNMELEAKLDIQTGQITISGDPYRLTYDYDTGFINNGESILMDVTVEAGGERKGGVDEDEDNSSNNDSSSEISHSDSGCNAMNSKGIGLILVALELLFMMRKLPNS